MYGERMNIMGITKISPDQDHADNKLIYVRRKERKSRAQAKRSLESRPYITAFPSNHFPLVDTSKYHQSLAPSPHI